MSCRLICRKYRQGMFTYIRTLLHHASCLSATPPMHSNTWCECNWYPGASTDWAGYTILHYFNVFRLSKPTLDRFLDIKLKAKGMFGYISKECNKRGPKTTTLSEIRPIRPHYTDVWVMGSFTDCGFIDSLYLWLYHTRDYKNRFIHPYPRATMISLVRSSPYSVLWLLLWLCCGGLEWCSGCLCGCSVGFGLCCLCCCVDRLRLPAAACWHHQHSSNSLRHAKTASRGMC